MKKIVPYFLLLIPLFTSGCFSAAERYGEAWGGGGNRKRAAALDVVTFPIQAPIVVPAYLIVTADEAADKHKAQAQADAYKQFMPLLEKDPALGLKERWDLKKDIHRWVFIQSFSNPKIKYTDALLEKIHETCPSIQDCVFSSKSCSKEFLAKHFDEEFERAKNPAYQGGLATIASNPNTPLDLVEKVATARGYAGGVTLPAQSALNQRRWERLMPLLKNDPSIAFRERWDANTNYVKRVAFEKSFADSNVKYSEELLETIYQSCPRIRDEVFISSSCSREFLAKHFDEEFARAHKLEWKGLDNLISNPNTSIELVEKVASPRNYHYPIMSGLQNVITHAQQILAERRSEQIKRAADSPITNSLDNPK